MCWGYTGFGGRFPSSRPFQRLIVCDYAIPSVLSRPCHWLANTKLEHCPELWQGEKVCKIYKEGGQKTTVICLHFSLLFETGSSTILMMRSKIATVFKQVSGLFGSASSPCFSRHTHISNTHWNLEKNAIRHKACSQNRSVFRIL